MVKTFWGMPGTGPAACPAEILQIRFQPICAQIKGVKISTVHRPVHSVDFNLQQVVIHQLYPVWSLLSRKTVFVYKYSQSDQDQLGCPEGDRSLLCGDGWMHLRPWCSQHLLSASTPIALMLTITWFVIKEDCRLMYIHLTWHFQNARGSNRSDTVKQLGGSNGVWIHVFLIVCTQMLGVCSHPQQLLDQACWSNYWM